MRVFASLFSVGVFLLFVGISVWSLKDSEFLKVSKLSIGEGTASSYPVLFQRILQDLEQKLNIYSGQPIWKISIAEIKSRLAGDKRIASFQITRKLPNQIFVSVTPKQPLAVLLDQKNRLFPISADGSLLPDLPLSDAPDLPVVRGEELFSDKKQRQQLVKVLSAIPENGIFSRSKISEVMKNKSGEVSVFMLEGGAKVLLGDELDQDQVIRIGQVLNYLKSRSIKGRVIDARFSKKVVVRVRNAS